MRAWWHASASCSIARQSEKARPCGRTGLSGAAGGAPAVVPPGVVSCHAGDDGSFEAAARPPPLPSPPPPTPPPLPQPGQTSVGQEMAQSASLNDESTRVATVGASSLGAPTLALTDSEAYALAAGGAGYVVAVPGKRYATGTRREGYGLGNVRWYRRRGARAGRARAVAVAAAAAAAVAALAGAAVSAAAAKDSRCRCHHSTAAAAASASAASREAASSSVSENGEDVVISCQVLAAN